MYCIIHEQCLRVKVVLGVGGLTAEDKMLVYLIPYIVTLRSSNHAQVTDDDLQIVIVSNQVSR